MSSGRPVQEGSCDGGVVTTYHGLLPDSPPQVLGVSGEAACARAQGKRHPSPNLRQLFI